jgi:hypothetical protein
LTEPHVKHPDPDIEAAFARLDAGIAAEKAKTIQPDGPGTTVICRACGHKDVYPGDALSGWLRCDECKAEYFAGVLRPKVTHMPHPSGDRRFLQQTIECQDDAGNRHKIALTLDRQFGGAIARDLLSVCP